MKGKVEHRERFERLLPAMCAVFVASNSPGKYVGMVKRFESGYFPTTYDELDPEHAKALVDHINRKLGVTPLQAECMHTGSLFGWDVPGADPDVMVSSYPDATCVEPAHEP